LSLRFFAGFIFEQDVIRAIRVKRGVKVNEVYRFVGDIVSEDG
jgi:hypothetical protein